MRKLLCGLASVMVVLLALFVAPATSVAAQAYDYVTLEGTADYARVDEQFRLLNAERAKVGARSLKMSLDLQRMAMKRAAEIAVYYDHTRPDGSSWSTLLPTSATGLKGENIAAGTDAAEGVTNQWMNSSGHRENMLNSEYAYVGIGCFTIDDTTYWVQNFATSVGGNTTMGGGPTSETYTIRISRSLVPRSSMSLVSDTQSYSLASGDSCNLVVRLRNPRFSTAYGITVDTKPGGYTWTSSNPSVVSVDVGGRVSAHASQGGSATITATSPGGYSWSRTFVVKRNISAASVANIPNQTYTGSAIKVSPVVTYAGERLVEKEDYSIIYPMNSRDYTNVGTVTITLNGIGTYSGTKKVTYKIVPRSLSGASVSSIPAQAYTGKEITPRVTLYLDGKQVQGTSYTVRYENNVQPGTASVIITGTGNYTGTIRTSFSIKGASSGDPSTKQAMHRLYNKWTGEHFYTAQANERDELVKVGWTYEGVGWYAPSTGERVYRLYNRFVEGGDHHYTMSEDEYESLWRLGWRQEGLAWRSANKSSGIPVYRQYNPYATTGTHNYTPNKAENDALVRAGWREEGIAWYGVR